MNYLNEDDIEMQRTILENFKIFVQSNGLPGKFEDNTYLFGINPQNIGGWTNCFCLLRFEGFKIEIIIHTKTITENEIEPRLYELLNTCNTHIFLGRLFVLRNMERIIYFADIVADNRDYDISIIFKVINLMLNEMVDHVVVLIDQYFESIKNTKQTAGLSYMQRDELNEKVADTDSIRSELEEVQEELNMAEMQLNALQAMSVFGNASKEQIQKQAETVGCLRERQKKLALALHDRGEGYVINTGGGLLIGMPDDGFNEDAEDDEYNDGGFIF